MLTTIPRALHRGAFFCVPRSSILTVCSPAAAAGRRYHRDARQTPPSKVLDKRRCLCYTVHRRAAPLFPKGQTAMHPQFTELTPRWFKRAFIYTGSIGEFRYRFNNDAKENVIHAAVYSQLCYELAADVAEQDFPWDDDGVEALKAWLQSRYEAYCAANA